MCSVLKWKVEISRDARYWILADIRYADILKLILSDADINIFPLIYLHFNFTEEKVALL